MSKIAPVTREEHFLARIAGDPTALVLEPQTRLEYFLQKIIDNGGPSPGPGLSTDVKDALLACFSHVAWTNEHGQDYYDALESALYPPADLVSISAVYTQSGTVYDTDSLDSLKSDLVVTATYEDNTERTVTDYTLSGTLAVGTSTITVLYGGKTTTFAATVTESNPFADATYERYPWVIYGNPTTPYADYIYKDTSTPARARLALPLANPNKTFTVADPTKYNIAVYNVTSLETIKISVPGNPNADAWPGTDNNKAWGTSGSSSAPYVALSFKKMDNTEFTDQELANMYGTVFTML